MSFKKRVGETEGREIYHYWRWRGFSYRSDLIAGDYMRRWVFSTPWGAIRLHHILRSDDDRHPHDHPMDFVSFILAGGYVEHRPGHPPRECKPGNVVARRAEDLHYLKLRGESAWTLVFAGPYRRNWGFLTEDGWVPAGEYDDWKRSKFIQWMRECAACAVPVAPQCTCNADQSGVEMCELHRGGRTA